MSKPVFYGLPIETLTLYRAMVKCGWDFDLAMKDLKEIYERNKAYHHSRLDRE